VSTRKSTHTHTHIHTHSVDPKYGEAYCQLGDVYKDSENIGLALQAYLQGIRV